MLLPVGLASDDATVPDIARKSINDIMVTFKNDPDMTIRED